MIFNNLYDSFGDFIIWFLGLLPDMDSSFLSGWDYIKDLLIDIFTGIGCLIPMCDLLPLIITSLSIWSFRFAWSIILRIKSFIPTLGG